MKMSRTTLKELAKRYRAVLLKCALINAGICIFTGMNIANAETPNSVYKITESTVSDYHFYTTDTSGTKYYKIRILASELDSTRIDWDDSNLDSYTEVTVNLPNNKTQDLYYKVKDTATITTTREDDLDSDINDVVYKGISSSLNGGAIYNSNNNGYSILADFINNRSTGHEGGGAIYNNMNSSIGSITGDFISNSANDGGAIYNHFETTITSITGDFISNSAAGNGGAIYNNSEATITSITGDFISNSAANGDGGGAICNKGTITTSITGNFISNSVTNGNGGAIYNGDNKTIGNITGDFISNSAGSGGAIYNGNNSKITSITGDFISNSATDTGSYDGGGAIFNAYGSTIGSITGDFISNSATNGGAIYNENSSEITSITGDFISNSATAGGAIYNKGTINFTGTNTFSNNTANGVANDIYNTGTIVIKSGSTTINGGISDADSPTGTITIGGDTDGTLVLGDSATLVQNTLKVNSTGTLALNASTYSDTAKFNVTTYTNEGTLKLTGGTLSKSISGNGTTSLATGAIIKVAKDVDFGNNKVISNNSTLDLRNNDVSKLELSTLVLNDQSSLYLDANLATKKMDTLTANTINGSGTLNIAGLTILSGATEETTTITFTDNSALIGVLSYTGETSYTFESITYTVSYSDGKFTFTKDENKLTKQTQQGGSSSDIQAASAMDSAVKEGSFDKEIYTKMVAHGGDAVKDIKPTETQATAETTMGTANMITNVVSDRLESRLSAGSVDGRFSGKNGGDERMGGAVWGKVIYNHSKQDSSSNNNGFKSDSVGFVLGADAELTDDLILGLGYAYDRTDISSGDKDTDVKSHTVFAYGKYNFTRNWFVRGNAGYNFANYEEKVSYLGGKMADYDVNSILANADIGYAMENGFTPMAGVRYAYMDKDAYTDEAGQHVESKKLQVLRGVVGVDYAKEVDTNGFKWTPKAGLGVSYDIKNTDSDVVVNVGSSSYRTDSKRLKREALEARVGVATSYKDWDFSIDYNLNLREKFQSHTGIVKAVYKF